ncbi:putative chromosome partitioning protein parB [Escherichia coli 2722950]|nr:putative chromosome partitioning protein parB [Escherichia coli 2722950]
MCVQRGVQLRSEDDVADDADRRNRCRKSVSGGNQLPADENVSTHAGSPGDYAAPDKSLALLAWTLCLNVFGSGATEPQIAWNVHYR